MAGDGGANLGLSYLDPVQYTKFSVKMTGQGKLTINVYVL